VQEKSYLIELQFALICPIHIIRLSALFRKHRACRAIWIQKTPTTRKTMRSLLRSLDDERRHSTQKRLAYDCKPFSCFIS